jgi:SAM-dependent methyltransferase
MVFPDVYVTKFFFKYGLDKAPGSLLELGCGNGNNARLFTEYGWHVTGIDIDGRALENARANWSGEPEGSWRFVEADLREGLPEVAGPFDALVANASLYYFERHYLEDLLDQVRPLLRPGAPVHLLMRTVDDWRYGRGEQVETDTYRLDLWQTAEEGNVMTFYRPDDLRALVEQHLGPLTDAQTLLSTHDNVQHGLHITNHDVVIWGRVD